MSRYAAADEEAIRTATRVRDWKTSGLLDADRAAAIEGELGTGLKRTHWALRAVLFVFTTSVIQSAIGFVFIVLAPGEAVVTAVLALVAGIGCFWLADFLAARYGLYRFGVEESCAVCSIVLAAGGMAMLASSAGLRGDGPVIVGLATAAGAGAVVYWRFGLLYAAIAASACAAGISFLLGLTEAWSRMWAAAVLLAIHVVFGVFRRPLDDDYPGDDYGVIESFAWLGAYALLNLKLTALFFEFQKASWPEFYWATYAGVWLLPVVGLYRGVAGKHRWMIHVSLLMLLATLVTNKAYLGWEHHAWDPMLLGLLLVGAALGIRRWLSSSADGSRHGFTPRRLLSSDEKKMAQMAFAAGVLKPEDAVRDAAGAEAYTPGGGRSGGGGATGGF